MSPVATDLGTALAIAVGHALRRKRVGRGMTAAEVASISGIARPIIHRTERGLHAPMLGPLAFHCAAVGLSLSELGDLIDRVNEQVRLRVARVTPRRASARARRLLSEAA
jgi:transcriptional regulator with XRE-family HTH domain